MALKRGTSIKPEKDWEVDIDGVQALADKNTVAMVIVNPGNLCGNVYTYEHLAKVSSNKLLLVLPFVNGSWGIT